MSLDSPPAEVRRASRGWVPWSIVIGAAAVIGVIHAIESTERIPPAEAQLAKFAAGALGVLLLMVWFGVWGPATRRTRVTFAGIVLAVVATLVAALKVDTVSGDVAPRFRWRWSPPADETLAVAASQANADVTIDLATTTSHDYPQYLGAERLARVDNVTLARDWQAEPPKQLWRQPIGAGWSSFAVVGDFAVTQEQRGQEELVTCYEVPTGKLLWAHSTPVRFFATLAGVGPRATPTIDAGKVYAMGAEGELVCLDGATGKPIWKHNVVTENQGQTPQWGKSCSPLVYENLVIVSAGGADGNSVVAYDKQTGDKIWSAGNDASSYCSPTVMTLCGQPQIVMVNQRFVTAHEPATGKILWQHLWPESDTASPNVSQPSAVGEDRILLSKGYAIGSALWQIARKDDQWSVEVLWKNNNLKTKFTNAVVRDGYAYALDEGVLECLEIATGKKQWKAGKYSHGQIILVGDLLLVQSERGDVALVEASPKKYRELARIAAVTGQSWNCPALAGRRLLVRTEQEAACYELAGEETKKSDQPRPAEP